MEAVHRVMGCAEYNEVVLFTDVHMGVCEEGSAGETVVRDNGYAVS
jgi:hypothetical protein